MNITWNRSRTRHDRKDATDLVAEAPNSGSVHLIDVDMDRNYKPM